MTNVLIVEDQKSIRKLLQGFVESDPKYRLIGAIETADNAPALCAQSAVDLVLMDIMTGSKITGLDATKAIKRTNPRIKVIIVTFLLDELALERARAVGADSMWYKDVGQEELLNVMARTMAGESVFPSAAPVVNVGFITSDQFTPREREVIRLVVKNLPFTQIAEKMGVSVDNIKWHLRNIYQKTGCRDKMDLMYAATDSKFINKNL